MSEARLDVPSPPWSIQFTAAYRAYQDSPILKQYDQPGRTSITTDNLGVDGNFNSSPDKLQTALLIQQT